MTTIIEKNHADLIKELEDKQQKIAAEMLFMQKKTKKEKNLWDLACEEITSIEKILEELKRPPWKM